MDADYIHPQITTREVPREFSDMNEALLAQHLWKVAKSDPGLLRILEIGVCRNGEHSSTTQILDIMDGTYLGVDIEDKSYLDEPNKGIYTFQTDSSNYDDIVRKLEVINHGDTTLDFLFIDGWHSVNQVLRDWRFAELVRPGGIVGFHDTNAHPGPYIVFDAIDETLFHKEKFLEEDYNDWGISFATKLPT